GPTAVSELYDPSTGTWSNTGNMTTAVDQATATLLAPDALHPGGEVLVAGGDTSANGSGGTPIDISELYNPSTGTWSTPTESMTFNVDQATATLLNSGGANGFVLVAGGNPSGGPTNGSQLYIPSTDTWVTAGTMATPPAFAATATLLNNGDVLVAGGFTGS